MRCIPTVTVVSIVSESCHNTSLRVLLLYSSSTCSVRCMYMQPACQATTVTVTRLTFTKEPEKEVDCSLHESTMIKRVVICSLLHTYIHHTATLEQNRVRQSRFYFYFSPFFNSTSMCDNMKDSTSLCHTSIPKFCPIIAPRQLAYTLCGTPSTRHPGGLGDKKK